MIIQLHIEMNDVKTTQQAHEMGHAIADHLYDTFNDNDSVSPLMYFKLFKNDGKTQIKEQS